jgi:PAS domain S-box-containing protein
LAVSVSLYSTSLYSSVRSIVNDAHGNWEPSAPEWLAAIVDSSDDAIVGKRLDGIIQSWNAGASRMFGYEASEIIGRSVLTLIPEHLRYQEAEIVARLVRGDRIDHFETVRQRSDGTLIDVSLSVSPIRDRSGAIIGAAKIARDITEANRLRQAERELLEQVQNVSLELEQQLEEGQALQEELESTNEELARAVEAARDAQTLAEEANAAKSQFLATMSHELRTPLNAIAGYIDLLDAGIRGPLTEAQRGDLARMKLSQQALLRLIEDVLSFAKLESGRIDYHLEHVAIDELIVTLETFVSPRLKAKNLSYHVEPCGTRGFAYVDRTKVEQILLNLLSNAVKFTDSGRIDVTCRTTASEILISVQDTGRGIQSHAFGAIFEPFVQIDRSLSRTAEGTGLGLSISRQLARAMGGDITVESIPGDGSIFTLILPLSSADLGRPLVSDPRSRALP